MKKLFKGFDKFISGFENWVSMIAFLAMVVVVIIIVLCRYVFKITFMQGEEIARYLMIWCGYAGAAYGFRHHSHVGVTVFADFCPKSWQHVIRTIRFILSAIVVIGLFVFALSCWLKYIEVGQLTTSLRIPLYTVYVIIPFSMLLSIFHTIRDIVMELKPKKNAEEVAE